MSNLTEVPSSTNRRFKTLDDIEGANELLVDINHKLIENITKMSSLMVGKTGDIFMKRLTLPLKLLRCIKCRRITCDHITNVTKGYCYKCAYKISTTKVTINDKGLKVIKRIFSIPFELGDGMGEIIKAIPLPYKLPINNIDPIYPDFTIPFGRFKGCNASQVHIGYIVNLAGYVVIRDEFSHSIKKLPPIYYIKTNYPKIQKMALAYIDDLCWHCGLPLESAKGYSSNRHLHVKHMSGTDRRYYSMVDYLEEGYLTKVCSEMIPKEFRIEDCAYQDSMYSYITPYLDTKTCRKIVENYTNWS